MKQFFANKYVQGITQYIKDEHFGPRDYIDWYCEQMGLSREEYMAGYRIAIDLRLAENKKPGPDPYHTGLDDEDVEDKEDQIKKQAEMSDDDPDAYKEMPGDVEAREKGKVKTSEFTKKYHELYGDDESNESLTEARAPKTKEELISALDDAYSKLDKYNTKYYEISTAPGGGSWSSSSKEGKAALKYKKMAGNQQANIWKWTDKLRKLGFEYNTNEAVVNEGQADVNKSYDKVIELIRKEARRLNDDDAYEFHERLKEFFNKTI